ncbi:MAG: FtsL-like putative cell division protein [Marinifilaceae bacterium]|jgi:hypothetical protein|nr:FtsL-like putative cell division protein [Marinifilaceae bacterium]
MFKFKQKYKDFIKPDEELKEISNGSFKDIINGRFLTRKKVLKQMPFIVYLVVFGIFYIGNRYKSEKIYQEMIELEQELKNLRFESLTTASNLMFISKQSEVIKKLEEVNLDLVESLEPPLKIKHRKSVN